MLTKESYFYVETAFHHQGELDYIYKLIDETSSIGVKGIKFQVLTKIDDFVSSKHDSYEKLATYCFSYNEWYKVFRYAKEKGLDIIIMPLNIESCKLIEEFEVKYIDIHSVSFNDISLLQKIKTLDKDIILGVGGRTLSEIYELIDYFNNRVKVLMTGFQSFPSKLENIKLGRIPILKQLFPDIEIGYADHSAFNDEYCITSNEYARLLGATVFEKHLTLKVDPDRVDSASAVTADKMQLIIKNIDFIERHILNLESLFVMTPEEGTYRDRQLVCVAKKKIEKGNKIVLDDVAFKMTNPNQYVMTDAKKIIGKYAKQDFLEDELFMENLIADTLDF